MSPSLQPTDEGGFLTGFAGIVVGSAIGGGQEHLKGSGCTAFAFKSL